MAVSWRDIASQYAARATAAARGQPGSPVIVIAGALRLAGRHDLWDRIGGSLVVSPARLQAAGWRPVVAIRDALVAMTAERMAQGG